MSSHKLGIFESASHQIGMTRVNFQEKKRPFRWEKFGLEIAHLLAIPAVAGSLWAGIYPSFLNSLTERDGRSYVLAEVWPSALNS